jgi:hypothetical protein
MGTTLSTLISSNWQAGSRMARCEEPAHQGDRHTDKMQFKNKQHLFADNYALSQARGECG